MAKSKDVIEEYTIKGFAMDDECLKMGLPAWKDAPDGKKIDVGDGEVHVYAEGQKSSGDYTLIVMSGSSMPAPVYSYKKLYSKFVQSYRVAVIEKLGYGYADITNSKRNVENILEQTRAGLKLGRIVTMNMLRICLMPKLLN